MDVFVGDYSPASDIYSIGVVLGLLRGVRSGEVMYKLLTGRFPSRVGR